MTETPIKVPTKVPEKVPPKAPEEAPIKWRGIIIVLCSIIVLLAALNIWFYSTKSTLQSELNSLETNFQDYQTTHSYNNTEYIELLNISNLEKFSVFENHVTFGLSAGQAIHWDYTIQYAGYIEVNVEMSTSTNTYVRSSYNEYSVIYDETILIGAGGKAVFPVLPGSIRVYVGNTNTVDDSTQTVTITYYY